MPSIRKAGAIILSQDAPAKILLLYRAREDDWTFPKGHIETGEDAKTAALREVLEETGLTTIVISNLPSIEYISSVEGKSTVEMFLVKSSDDTQLKTEHPNDRLEWLVPEEVTARLSYDNLKEHFSGIQKELR
jgi:8-oxo-dGTP diphosphatase